MFSVCMFCFSFHSFAFYYLVGFGEKTLLSGCVCVFVCGCVQTEDRLTKVWREYDSKAGKSLQHACFCVCLLLDSYDIPCGIFYQKKSINSLNNYSYGTVQSFPNWASRLSRSAIGHIGIDALHGNTAHVSLNEFGYDYGTAKLYFSASKSSNCILRLTKRRTLPYTRSNRKPFLQSLFFSNLPIVYGSFLLIKKRWFAARRPYQLQSLAGCDTLAKTITWSANGTVTTPSRIQTRF